MDEDNGQPDAPLSGTGATTAQTEFFGSYTHSIDAKGRIIVPNAYREALGEVFTIGPTRDFKGVALYPNAVFDAIRNELKGMNQRKPFVQTYTMQFFKLSYRDMQADGQGRLLLPPKLRQRILGEARDLEISGIDDYVCIQDAEKANLADTSFTEHLDDILEQIGNLEQD